MSLVQETDLNTEIEYCWDHIPEKLTPGHRQRGSERMKLYCLPFRIRRNGKYVYSHWNGKEFVNPVPERSPKLEEFIIGIAKIFLSKNMKFAHVQRNSQEVLHDMILFLYEKCCLLNLNKYDNPAPVLLFWMGNHSKSTSKQYFPAIKGEPDYLSDERLTHKCLN